MVTRYGDGVIGIRLNIASNEVSVDPTQVTYMLYIKSEFQRMRPEDRVLMAPLDSTGTPVDPLDPFGEMKGAVHHARRMKEKETSPSVGKLYPGIILSERSVTTIATPIERNIIFFNIGQFSWIL